ncbi:hypothetical protein HanXRQr2_Chr13g0574441 [Helianthus annuus]|uniref:Uncharacterized protein n=1 Tax=Helianthus annuus TaxID=4232 RepID=A0A9K3EG15_HELAN|nr:hypothetical protein HanXRQr2_Chr13g0574441 [Helianthus annuus]
MLLMVITSALSIYSARLLLPAKVKLCFIYLSEKLGDFYIHAFCRVRGQWE